MVWGLCIMWYESVSIWSSFGSVVILQSGYCQSFQVGFCLHGVSRLWCSGVQFEEDKKEQNLLRTVLLGYNSLNCLGSELLSCIMRMICVLLLIFLLKDSFI
jgi:hypothetical protein